MKSMIRPALLAVLLLTSLVCLGQAVPMTGDATLKLAVISGGVRTTNPNFNPPVAATPFWHGASAPGDPIDSTQTLTRNVAYSLSLAVRCSVDAGSPAGVFAFSDVSGSYPIGVTRSTSTVSGTPTSVESQAKSIRCTFTPDVGSAGIADQTITFNVIDPDNTAPTVPQNLTVAPQPAGAQDKLRASWNASTDASGILKYNVRYANTQTDCATGASTLVAVNDPAVLYDLGGLAANSTRWFKVAAVDNSAAQNVSASTTCTSGTTAGGGGGGTLLFTEDWETGAIDYANKWIAVGDTCDAGCSLAVQSVIKRSGNFALKTVINFDPDGSNWRQEIRVKGNAAMNVIQWYGWSVYLVAPYANDTQNEVYAQWHVNANHSSTLVNNGVWKYTNMGQPPLSGPEYNIGPIATNVWTDFVLEAIWSTTTNGLIKIWKNGVLVVDRPNVVTVDPTFVVTPYLKIGLYKSNWKTGKSTGSTLRTVYHDCIKWGDQNSSYAQVVPPC